MASADPAGADPADADGVGSARDILAVYCGAVQAGTVQAGQILSARLPWQPGCTALALARLAQQRGVFPQGMDAAAALGDAAVRGDWQIGVWGRPARADTLLTPGDRLECWRPLTVDPKTARHQRHARQKAAGLLTGVGAGARRRGGAPVKPVKPPDGSAPRG